MTFAEIKQKVFVRIEEMGFHPYDIEKVDEYFILPGEEDSITHFRIKEVWKSWKFGLWITRVGETNDIQIDVFCQNELNLDKFKPSRSYFCATYKLKELEGCDKWNMYTMEEMIKMIKYHPFISYGNENYFNYFYKRSYIADYLEDYLKDRYYACKKAVYKKVFLWYTKAKLHFFKKSKYIKNIELYEFSKKFPGLCTEYIYKVIVDVNGNFPHEEIDNYLYKFFKKDDYGFYDECKFESVIRMEWHMNGKLIR